MLLRVFCCENLFETKNIPKLSDESSDLWDEIISIEELWKALKDILTRKSPRTDDLNTEFYQFIQPSIKEIVFESLSEGYENNFLSIEQKRGILSIILNKREKSVKVN